MIIKKAIMLLAVIGMLAFVAIDVANSKNKEKTNTEYIQQQNSTIKTTTNFN